MIRWTLAALTCAGTYYVMYRVTGIDPTDMRGAVDHALFVLNVLAAMAFGAVVGFAAS